MPSIAGIGVHHPAPTDDLSLEELVFAATRAALDDARLERDSIDGVCIAASDQLDGRAISSMHLAGPSGARLRDEIKVADDGSVALAAAALRVEAGVSDRVLVVSWTKPDASDTPAALGVNPEPIFTRPVGLHPWVAEAMVMQAFMREARIEVSQVDAWAERLSGSQNLDGGWLAYPLRVTHMPPATQSAVALVVTADPAGVRIDGMSWGVDPAPPVERRGVLGSLPTIAAKAFREAGFDPVPALPVETTDRSVVRLCMAAVGLGLTTIDRVVADFDAGAFSHLNRNGGLWSTNPVFAAGLECVARAAEHVRNGEPTAVAHANYGYAGQGNLVAVLGKEQS